ncbi:uncharacterized protein LOC128350256 isoform X2 [Hemicordylus capensis]|uniref:uncharacterized protein LOC128350256 isoform X2 n=1 Tax=Hemicordylus capensis TaxID=884348 RepID=UPI002302DD97|nr:uncharacterized protein LOC128350256 isoform X2 [Hemicordylus capensis]
MDSDGLHQTSDATTGNPELVKGAQLQTDDRLASPEQTRAAQSDPAAREHIHTDIGKEPIMRDLQVQITDWDAQILPNREEESLKRSKYSLGGSADSVLSLTSSYSLLPLEWKTLRSSQSQGTLAQFSGVMLENEDGRHKPASDNNQDVVDDIIGDEVVFKVCTHVLNHHSGAAYTIDSRTDPIVHSGSLSCKNANCPNQFSNDSPCMSMLSPRTEKLLEVGMLANQAHSSAIDPQDSDLVNQLWTAAVSPKSLYKTSIASIGWGNISANEEKDIPNKQQSVPSLPKFECSSPTILQQRIVSLKSQISDLQEANETAVLELAKADEEISQLKNEMAKLKSEYLQKIADSKEENLILKKKINRIHNRHGPIDTYEQALHEEICELRSESKSLREISHQLNEENHRLKEELWDVKRKYKWLMYTVAGKQDERLQEPSRNNTSLSSINSESTDVLTASYCDTGLPNENRGLKDEASEKNTNASSSNSFCAGQRNQRSSEKTEQRISSSASSSLSQLDTCSKYSSSRVHMDKAALSRRPFAPRNVTDLKVGNLVKFSCPTGKISKGTVKYLGPLFGREDDYLGIELDGNQMGRHDGTFQGTRYFLCEPNKGVFVNFRKVIIAWE